MKVQTILPGKVDPLAKEKRIIWASAGERHGVDVKLPPLPPPRSAVVLSDTIMTLRESDIVVADLSFERPSCYYELGLAQAVNAPVILLMTRGTILHQHAPVVDEYIYYSLRDYEEIVDGILTG